MPEPTMVLVTGPPGTGKSTIAEAVATRLSGSVLAWDWVMAALAPVDEIQDALNRLDSDHYRRVGWSILWNLAIAQLRNHRSVVLDGTARAAEIDATRRVGADVGARCLVVVTRCSDLPEHRRRIDGRSRNIPGWYELDWDHVTDFLSRWQEPSGAEVYLDAIRPLAENLTRLDALLTDPGAA